MELARGTNVGDIWFDMSGGARIAFIRKLVELESRLFALKFPASGSLYYTKDLRADERLEIPFDDTAGNNRFCIGPDTTLALWFGKRMDLPVFRGPYKDPESTLAAGAKKEIAYLQKYGRALQPFNPVRRETYGYQKQSPQEHLDNLQKYLKIVPYLIPRNKESLHSPTIRHPDLQPNNIFVSDDLDITALIDWQHCAISPLLVQCGIPNHFQNYGDQVSESLQAPELPDNFDDLEETRQFQEVLLLRKRQLHYYYVVATANSNNPHYDALTYGASIVRGKLYHRASDPWEGDNVDLKATLVQFTQRWDTISKQNSASSTDARIPCPISFSEEEVNECMRIETEQIAADESLQRCKDAVGVGPDTWMPADLYEETKECERKFKEAALVNCESEEDAKRLAESWIFDDFDEEEYE